MSYGRRLPLLVEKGEDGFYVVECPLFEGCYTQGKTLDEALNNIREVIILILEEKGTKQILKNYLKISRFNLDIFKNLDIFNLLQKAYLRL
ncbi:type II toxin-antitoxin system HicB family antitoxin [Candidatus Wolfebacteria bacterium]|nr:type II toxin-antitoxin system HicB family antitoxin [Candidatus Wolfebacteria bacterium]